MFRYKWVYSDDGRRILKHRLIMEKHLGRRLKSCEHIHHINEDVNDDRIENLKLVTMAEHIALHRKEAKKPIECICENCGNSYMIRAALFKWKKKQNQKFFCSRKCIGSTFPIQSPDKHIEELVKQGLKDGLSGYAISKKYGLNKASVYNHIGRMV